MTQSGIYFVYGLCIMFYSMMAWFFLHKNRETLSRLVAALMILLVVQCVKDLFFISPGYSADEYLWMVVTSVDMVAVPLYAFILMELCSPGSVTARTIVVHEIPFVALPLLFVATQSVVLYFADVVWAAVYGTYYASWTIMAIPRYHRRLKQRFSYVENINLNWLRTIMLSFYAILALWFVDCVVIDLGIEALYMLGSLVIWIFIGYFIYRHESVIDELCEPMTADLPSPVTEAVGQDALAERIRVLFEAERVFLNPHLKLSDVALMTNSNRTYVSRFFNNSHGKTFFEFVNEYRVSYAKELLKTTTEKLDVVAEMSGFNSRQSFHRVFSKLTGCTPEKYRSAATI